MVFFFRGLFWPGRHGSSCRKSRFRLGSLLISIVVFPKLFRSSGLVMNIVPYLLRCVHENDRNMSCDYSKLGQSGTRTTKFRSDEPAHLRLRHLIAVGQKNCGLWKKASLLKNSLIVVRKRIHSVRSLVRFLILLNSWIKIVHAHFPENIHYFSAIALLLKMVGFYRTQAFASVVLLQPFFLDMFSFNMSLFLCTGYKETAGMCYVWERRIESFPQIFTGGAQ